MRVGTICLSGSIASAMLLTSYPMPVLQAEQGSSFARLKRFLHCYRNDRETCTIHRVTIEKEHKDVQL
jgi:hypothetical protein